MTATFTSVLLFHSALKSFLMETVGLTVERILGANDVILTNGAGTFLRLQRQVEEPVAAVGMELGADADALEVSTKDPEYWFPFDTATGGTFQGEWFWDPETTRLSITIIASGEKWSKRYRAEIVVGSREMSLVHQDHLDQATEPNFKERGGTYVQAGA